MLLRQIAQRSAQQRRHVCARACDTSGQKVPRTEQIALFQRFLKQRVAPQRHLFCRRHEMERWPFDGDILAKGGAQVIVSESENLL